MFTPDRDIAGYPVGIGQRSRGGYFLGCVSADFGVAGQRCPMRTCEVDMSQGRGSALQTVYIGYVNKIL